MESIYNVQLEKLTKDEIYIHLCESADDFTYTSEQLIKEYANKLAEYAEFVTIRDNHGSLIGIIAYYANNSQFAYISHLWVANCCRGGGCCGKMLDVLSSECIKRHIYLIKLEVRNDNRSAISAYQKFGFEFSSKDDSKSQMKKELPRPPVMINSIT